MPFCEVEHRVAPQLCWTEEEGMAIVEEVRIMIKVHKAPIQMGKEDGEAAETALGRANIGNED